MDVDMNGDINASEKSMWLWKWSTAQTRMKTKSDTYYTSVTAQPGH